MTLPIPADYRGKNVPLATWAALLPNGLPGVPMSGDKLTETQLRRYIEDGVESVFLAASPGSGRLPGEAIYSDHYYVTAASLEAFCDDVAGA